MFVIIIFNIMKRFCEKIVVLLIRDEVLLLYMYVKFIFFIYMWLEVWVIIYKLKIFVVDECKIYIMF